MAEPVYSREVDVVWRLAHDRVLVRHARLGASNGVGDEAADLMGLAALVWVALDEPGGAVQLTDRLAGEDLGRPVEEVDDVVRQLVAAGWVRVLDAEGA